MIQATCACGKVLKVKDELAGRKGKCPACGAVVVIPGKAASAPTAPAVEAPPTRRTAFFVLVALAATLLLPAWRRGNDGAYLWDLFSGDYRGDAVEDPPAAASGGAGPFAHRGRHARAPARSPAAGLPHRASGRGAAHKYHCSSRLPRP